MIQFEDKRGDIYQILSFCLGYLKRKILILLKVFVSQKNYSPRPQLIIQLANEQQAAQQHINILRERNELLIKKQNEILFQRFVYRIKQLVRNYLPHASISHELFVYLKKIQTYSFKQNYKFENYIIYILEQNPASLQKQIHYEMHELKSKKFTRINSPKRYELNFQENYERINSIKEYRKLSLFKSSNLQLDQQQNNDQTLTKTSQNQNNRPIDIFNRSVQSFVNCMDCDISIIRGIYFNLQKQKENCTQSKNISQAFSNNNKLVKQIEDQMLTRNRFIKQTVKIYDRQYLKYLHRLQRDCNSQRRDRKRCQTADVTRRQYNFSILPNSNRSPQNKMKQNDLNKKKFDTISNYTTQQQRQQLYRQIQKRKANVLKMKSICISANKGQLQLCSLSKEQSKKFSLTLNNLRKTINRNNSKNTAINLKRKYEMFLNSCSEKNNELCDNNRTLPTQKYNFTSKISVSGHTDDVHSRMITNQILSQSSKKKDDSQIDFKLTINTDNEVLYNQFFQSQNKNFTLRKQVKAYLHQDKLHQKQIIKKCQTINSDFQNSIKNVMKGGNVNHRNYANLQQRQRRLFQTLNPELTIKTIRKS